MNYQRFAFSELFNDPFFSTLGSQAAALMRTTDRSRPAPSMQVTRRNGQLPVTVVRRNDALLIRCEVPGASIDDISVTVDGDRMEIVAQRSVKHAGRVLRSERWSGERRRVLRLPFAVDGEKVQAQYRRGVLTVDLSVAPKHVEKKIQITRKQEGEV